MKVIFNLPFYSQTCGGINATIEFAKSLNAEIRFQSVQRLYPHGLPVPFTVGKADSTFPSCDLCITYSDDPFANQLTNLPRVQRVACYFQSYGMSINNERNNARNKWILNLCSSYKIEKDYKKFNADDSLEKPFEMTHLLAKIDDLLHSLHAHSTD